ncbi:hypothetical protein [Hymenobacter ruber]
MNNLEFLLTNYAKVKDGQYELFLEEHASFLDCVPELILAGVNKQQKVAEWMEVFEPLTYQIVSLSNAVQNALDGTVHGKHSANSVVRLDLSTVFILARAQLEAYLTFFYLCIQPQSQEEAMLRYQLYVASGLSMRQTLVKSNNQEFISKLKLEQDRIDNYRKGIGNNKVFGGYTPSRKGQLLTEGSKKPARVKNWEQLISDSRLQTELFTKSWNLYSNHAHAEYIGLIQTRDYLLRPEDALRLRPHTMHKSLMLIATFIKDLVDFLGVEEFYQKLDAELILKIDFWERFSSSNINKPAQ